MDVSKVAVVGAGTMGSSIATALIGRNFPVQLKDVDKTTLDAGLAKIDRMLQSQVKKGLLTEEQASNQKRLLEPVTDYACLVEADFVIEAVAEQIDIKKSVFEQLDQNCDVNAIFASNTSSLSITQLAAFTRRPDKVVGMHFFNPAHIMKLVEVIPGLDSSPDTVLTALQFGRALGKLAIRVEECASFLVNRLLGRYMNESLWCLQDRQASVEEIDKAVCDYVMPIGPLALRDMNGADIGLAVARFNYQEYGERFRPAPVLEQMVESNLLGQKTAEGFYLYDPETKKRTVANPKLETILDQISNLRNTESMTVLPDSGFKVERLFLPMINEAFLCLQERICDPRELDPALMAGLGMRKGPLMLAEEMGFKTCLSELEKYFSILGERFRPAPLLKRYIWAGRTSVL